MTGMKINYDKSDLLTIGTDEERVNEFANSKKTILNAGYEKQFAIE